MDNSADTNKEVGQQALTRQREHWKPEQKQRWWDLYKFEGLTPQQIAIKDKQLSAEGKLDRPASYKTIDREIKNRLALDGAPWMPMRAPESEAALVLPVLGIVAEVIGQTPSITTGEAASIARIRRIRPSLMTETYVDQAINIFLLGLDYAHRLLARLPTDDLDIFLTWAPWERGTEREQRRSFLYEAKVQLGQLPPARHTAGVLVADESTPALFRLRQLVQAQREANAELFKHFGQTRQFPIPTEPDEGDAHAPTQ